MPKVLITDAVHALLLSRFKERGYEVSFMPDITYAETLAVIQYYDGLVVNSKIYCGEALLANASKLKWIARLGSGMEVIDTIECDKRSIRYFNTPEGNSNAVAEHTLGLLLSLMRNISKANQEVRNNQWIREANRGEELSGKTVGIIGFGHTGSAFAKVLSGFNVTVLAYDKYKTDFSNGYVHEAKLESIYEEADVLSLHLPLTQETSGWIDETFLSRFKKPIYFLNTSRGKVLKTKDALVCMQLGKIKTMALDVLENEKINSFNDDEQIIFNQLVNDQRILLTPHIAGWTRESKKLIAEKILEKLFI